MAERANKNHLDVYVGLNITQTSMETLLKGKKTISRMWIWTIETDCKMG